RIHPVWRGARVSGRAFTAACSTADNLAIHVAVAEAPPDSVLVASVGLEPERGYWGEVLTTAAKARRLRGLVIDGGVRDADALEAHRFPVFAAMIALRGATKQEPGRIGDAASVGGVDVHTGDWIVGDADGVTVVPRERLDEVLAAGRARAEKEQRFFEQLRAGRTTLELLGLDDAPIDRV
ncbi:MAG TPA: RraA family protein, partial [Acidimicrobiia bacterium]|nr:RraA family protein [Acidimicrobiia bacterium]